MHSWTDSHTQKWAAIADRNLLPVAFTKRLLDQDIAIIMFRTRAAFTAQY